MMRVFLLIITVLFITSCANTADTSSIESLEGEYKVIGLNGKRITGNEMIFTFDPVGNRISGDTGCNNFSANYSQEGQELDFSTPMNTRKYCEGRMETEREILSSIEKSSRLQFSGNEVMIYADGEEPLITLTKIK